MSILVTGTLAVDHIATVADGFDAGDLNGKLNRPTAHWGGCGMNLSYALSRAGYRALPWVFYGDNCPEGYQVHLQSLDIDQTAMCRQTDSYCAEAYIFSRPDGSQLTGFYPGSTQFEPPNKQASSAISRCEQWIAGPEDDATLLSRLPYIESTTELYWMPGQYVDVTRHNVLEPMLKRRPNLLVNKTEWATLERNVGADKLQATTASVFVTLGAAGVRFRLDTQSNWQECSTAAAKEIDPTGCGDAFCASLVAGLAAGMNPTRAITIAQAQAALCLGLLGAQSY